MHVQLALSSPTRLSGRSLWPSAISSTSSQTVFICRGLVPVARTRKSVTGEMPLTSSTTTLWQRVLAARRAESIANCLAASSREASGADVSTLEIVHLLQSHVRGRRDVARKAPLQTGKCKKRALHEPASDGASRSPLLTSSPASIYEGRWGKFTQRVEAETDVVLVRLGGMVHRV